MSDGDVTFTVKELIGKLDVKLDLLIAKVGDKADSGAVKALDERITSLELDRAATRSALNTTRFICVTAIPVAAGLAAHFIR